MTLFALANRESADQANRLHSATPSLPSRASSILPSPNSDMKGFEPILAHRQRFGGAHL